MDVSITLSSAIVYNNMSAAKKLLQVESSGGEPGQQRQMLASRLYFCSLFRIIFFI